MKAESTVQPPLYDVEYNGGMAKITFYENVEQKPTEEGEADKWEYDEYHLDARARENLIASLEINHDAWLLKAKGLEGIKPEPTVEERVGKVESDVDDLVTVLAALEGVTA